MADMSTHTSDWYAVTQAKCPTGDPGVYVGEVSTTRFPVIRDEDGLLWYQHTTGADSLRWSPMRGWDASRFTPDEDTPEWAEQCDHPTLCDSERDCDALHFEEGDGSW